jgi:hypothetical protein
VAGTPSAIDNTKLPLAGGSMTGAINMSANDIVNAGKIGIGTATPQTKLHIVGSLTLGDGAETCSSPIFGTIRYSGSQLQLCTGGAWTTMLTTATGGDFRSDGSMPMAGMFQAYGGSMTAPGVTFASDTNTGIYSAAADVLGIATAGTERMRIDSAGKVGIGTTAPNQEFHVKGNAMIQDPTGGSNGANLYLSGNHVYRLIGGDSSGSFSIYDGSMAATRFLVDQNGNVGIGTTFPVATLDVWGTTHVQQLSVGGGGTPLNNMSICSYNNPSATSVTSSAAADVSVNCGGATTGMVASCSPDQAPIDPETTWTAYTISGYVKVHVTTTDPSTGGFAANTTWKCILMN